MQDLNQSRQTNNQIMASMTNMEPESLRNSVYTAGFLRTQIGKLMRIEFLIGTTMLQDRIGILEEVGASYIILRTLEGNSRVFCDIYSIKFITISDNPFVYNPNFQM